MPSSANHTPSVKDQWLFLSVYPVMALLAVHIGNDNTVMELLQIPSYYSDVLLALICTYGVGFYYRWLFRWIDTRFSWETQQRERLIQQVGFGICLPIGVIIGIECLYLVLLLDIPIGKSTVFYLELPIVAIFCLLLNLIYYILYHRKYTATLAMELEERASREVPEKVGEKHNFVVNAGPRAVNILTSEVAYLIIQQKSTFLVTHEGKSFLYDTPLERIIQDLSPNNFYQLNRQVIAHRTAVHSYERTDTRKVKVELIPAPSEPIYVSKSKAAQFLAWMKQG